MNKYRAKRTQVDGIWFDSIKESTKYQELKLLQRAGEISDLELKPKFKFVLPDGTPVLIRSRGYPNGRVARFTGDFAYFDKKLNRRVILDVKGGRATMTEAYAIRKALVEALFKVIVEEA